MQPQQADQISPGLVYALLSLMLCDISPQRYGHGVLEQPHYRDVMYSCGGLKLVASHRNVFLCVSRMTSRNCTAFLGSRPKLEDLNLCRKRTRSSRTRG